MPGSLLERINSVNRWLMQNPDKAHWGDLERNGLIATVCPEQAVVLKSAAMTEMPRWVIALATCFLTCCSARPPASNERQLTSTVGIARSPVLSHDGSTLAFAATPGNRSDPQIWATRLDHSVVPVQVTGDAAQNYDPELTPDGGIIYYTSSRTPRGIYRVPASGGLSELVIEQGFDAKISPDGKTILFGRGIQLYRRAIDGGPSTLVLPRLENSYNSAWSPDGSRVLVTAKNLTDRDSEWWDVLLDGGEQRNTGIAAELRKWGFESVILNAWFPSDWIVFSGTREPKD